MKNKSTPADDDPLDREIDFSRGRPNPYWLGVVDRKCVRVIDADLAELFPDNDAVNRALRVVAAARKPRMPKISARRVTASKKR